MICADDSELEGKYTVKKLLKIGDIQPESANLFHLKEQADIFRSEFQSYNKNLLNETNTVLSVDDFGNAPDGRFTISYNNIDFDCFFKRDRNSDRLYIVFSGSRAPGRMQPTFRRWTYHQYMDGSMLNIDDPMCKIYPKLNLGWYYGTKDESYCDYISEIVEEFAKRNGIQNKNIIFFSSSGGGFSALYCACKVKNSMAVVLNPQINPKLYHYGKVFEEVTGIDFNEKDIFRRNDLAQLISESTESRFLIIQNIESIDDMIQLDYVCSVFGVDYRYGLMQIKPNILSWTYQAKSNTPHNAQEYPIMFLAIEYLIENFEKAKDYEYLYLLMSEIWYDHYQLVNNITLEKDKQAQKCTLLDSYDLYNVNESFCATVVNKETSFIVPARTSQYNHYVIHNDFEASSVYELKIYRITALEGMIDEVTVLLQDVSTKRIDINKSFSLKSGGVILFATGQNSKNMALKLYPGKLGCSQGLSVEIDKCILRKIEHNCNNI